MNKEKLKELKSKMDNACDIFDAYENVCEIYDAYIKAKKDYEEIFKKQERGE